MELELYTPLERLTVLVRGSKWSLSWPGYVANLDVPAAAAAQKILGNLTAR